MLSAVDLAAWDAALAALDPPPRDVFAEIGYTPTSKQQLFHDATEDVVLFGGSLGGGKSIAAMAEAIRACALHPGIRVGVFRRSYGELRDALLPPLVKLGFGQAVGGHWNGTDFELRFANGSLVGLRYVENLVDATRRQGAEYQLLIFDELNLLQPEAVSFLESRLRSGRADLPVLGVRATANPGGPAHGHVRSKYIEATDYGAKVIVDEGGRTIRFIPSSMSDNPHLDGAYNQRLLTLPPDMRRAMRDGDWTVFSGQMFTELSRARHIVDPMPLPASWQRCNGIDWGYTKPWAVLWGAVDEDGRVWIYRELYETLVRESDQAARILAAETEDEHVTQRFADDAMWDTRGEAKAIADVYADNGVYLSKAGKGAGSRVQGWQRIHQYLAEAPACPHHRALGWDTCPMLHLFPQVTNLYRELTDLPYATKGNVEDADTDASDHACLVAGTAVFTRRGEVPIETVTTSDEVMTRKGWRRVLAAGLTGVARPVVTVELGDGRSFTATPDHPVWTETRGWVRSDALRYSDTLVAWPDESKPAGGTASPSGATPTQPAGRTGRTSRLASLIANAASIAYTARSGRLLTVLSRLVTTCITAITTTATTPSTTSSASPMRSIASTTPTNLEATPRNVPGWPTRPKPRSGTAAKRGAPGTSSTANAPGKDASRTNAPASGAVTRSGLGMRVPRLVSAPAGTGPTPGKPAGWMTRTASARAAERHSGSTGTPRPAPAPARVVSWRAAGRADVYNLTVEGEPEFFANGVLVHNCDALRYLLRNLGSGPSFYIEPPADPNAPPPLVGGPPADQLGTPFAGRFVLLQE